MNLVKKKKYNRPNIFKPFIGFVLFYLLIFYCKLLYMHIQPNALLHIPALRVVRVKGQGQLWYSTPGAFFFFVVVVSFCLFV